MFFLHVLQYTIPLCLVIHLSIVLLVALTQTLHIIKAQLDSALEWVKNQEAGSL